MTNETEALRLSRLADAAKTKRETASAQGKTHEAAYWLDWYEEYQEQARKAREDENLNHGIIPPGL